MMKAIRHGLLIAAALAAVPALADVEAGVDAWARGDYKKAVAEWRGPAIAGDADAQFNLGQAYKLGRGVPVDLPQAVDWYRKAALQGHVQAEDSYGLTQFQINKRGQAAAWLEKSATRDEPRAQFVLGTMYFNADSVKRDWVKAYALMLRAAAQNLAQASSTLAQMDRYIGLNERQQGTQLARHFEEAASRKGLAGLTAPAASDRSTIHRAAPTDVAMVPEVRRSGTVLATRVTSTTTNAPHEPTPSVIVRSQPKPANVGAWRVQLGAFRDVGNARGLFARLARGPLSGKQQYLVRSGTVTRLLAGPYATPADAARACGPVRAAGSECVPTRG